MSEQTVALYPQAHPMSSDELKSFLARPLIAKLCTHNQDGTIHVVPIWFRHENGEILFGTQEISRKVRNIKRDNRVTVLVDTTRPRLAAVIVYGTAQLDYDEVIPTRISIFEKYMEPERARGLAGRLAGDWRPVVIRVKPERVISFDYRKGIGISARPDAPSITIV